MGLKDVEYTEIDVTSDLDREREMVARSMRRTVPQILIMEESVGGYDDLARPRAISESPSPGASRFNLNSTVSTLELTGIREYPA